MTVQEKFNQLAQQWSDHCRNVCCSSKASDYLRHPAYQELVALGPVATPLIIDRYQQDNNPFWGFMLQEITGIQMVNHLSNFSPVLLKARWLAWWRRVGPEQAAPAAKSRD
jgi:hypothetical protein